MDGDESQEYDRNECSFPCDDKVKNHAQDSKLS